MNGVAKICATISFHRVWRNPFNLILIKSVYHIYLPSGWLPIGVHPTFFVEKGISYQEEYSGHYIEEKSSTGFGKEKRLASGFPVMVLSHFPLLISARHAR